jgi:hypothetical protein
MPELDRQLHVRGLGGDERGQIARGVGVALELGGRLRQHGPELVAERLEGADEIGHRLARLVQAALMRDRAWQLGGEHEPVRRVPLPRARDRALGRRVERVVELDRVEHLGVERQAVLLLGTGRVEHTVPIGIRPALRAEPDAGAHR